MTSYLEICACGHRVLEHGADVSEIGTDEFRRRGSVTSSYRSDLVFQAFGSSQSNIIILLNLAAVVYARHNSGEIL